MSKTRLPQLTALCVFCGSSPGADSSHRDAAVRLGGLLAEQRIALVYGGGRVGLMGALAEAAIGGGGRVVGIIPEHLTRIEAAYQGVSELHIVDSMHTRKRRMFDLADAFCVLPGGLGTMDETFEILTWKQLRLHNKPIVLVNQGGYWDAWMTLVDRIIGGGFAGNDVRRLFTVVDDVDDVLPAVQSEMRLATAGEPELF